MFWLVEIWQDKAFHQGFAIEHRNNLEFVLNIFCKFRKEKSRNRKLTGR